MNKQLTKLALVAGFAAVMAGPASAGLVAGWDFSNLPGDSAAVPASLAANYTGSATASALDVTGDVIASAMRPGAAEADQSGLVGGINGNGQVGDPTFGPGQAAFDRKGELLGLTARSAATAEFDVTTAAPTSDFWMVTFGASAITQDASETTQLDVRFGGSCAGAASVGTVDVGQDDTEVKLFLGQLGSAGGCVVIGMDGSTTQPLIDNVALTTVPEPGIGAMLLAGVGGLLGLSRRRAR